MNDTGLFLSEKNRDKFLKDEPFLEKAEDGRVDFCLGKNLDEASEIFRKYLEVEEGN